MHVAWPDARPFEVAGRAVLRVLAASDEHDPTLDHPANRDALGHIDLVVGCGDLSPERVAFLGDAFPAPLVYVRGNHDHGGAWRAANDVPAESVGVDRKSLPGISLLALPWPTVDRDAVRRDEAAAWGQVARILKLRLLTAPKDPWLVFSHAPPKGAGDSPEDPYHVGFAAYAAVLDRLRPPLWLHGHTSRADARMPVVEHGATTLVNVTGSVLVELESPRGTVS
jgi:hypothetical protein